MFGFRDDFDFKTRLDLKDTVGDYVVSTVDLGINHQFDEGEPPLYYETMIFGMVDGKIDFADKYCERYTTEEQAREGHARAIEYAKENL